VLALAGAAALIGATLLIPLPVFGFASYDLVSDRFRFHIHAVQGTARVRLSENVIIKNTLKDYVFSVCGDRDLDIIKVSQFAHCHKRKKQIRNRNLRGVIRIITQSGQLPASYFNGFDESGSFPIVRHAKSDSYLFASANQGPSPRVDATVNKGALDSWNVFDGGSGSNNGMIQITSLKTANDNQTISEKRKRNVGYFGVAKELLPPAHWFPIGVIGAALGFGIFAFGEHCFDNRKRVSGALMIGIGGLNILAGCLTIIFSPML